MHSTDGVPGSWNDKTKAKFDDYVSARKSNELLNNTPWELKYYDKTSGEVKTRIMHGTYDFVDGGYLESEFLIHSWKVSSVQKQISWSHMHESLRKCIECCFGILKARFRLLKFGTSWPTLEKTDNYFKTACALHNILLEYDEKESDYASLIDLDEGTVIGARMNQPLFNTGAIESIALRSTSFDKLRNMLVDHYEIRFVNRQVTWPSKTGKIKRFNFDAEDENIDAEYLYL